MLDGDGSDDTKKDDGCGCNGSFECNICFESAKDPVVTPCGHLFCWPCIYQWLHGHSEHSDCPVCKGEVLEVNVTPRAQGHSLLIAFFNMNDYWMANIYKKFYMIAEITVTTFK